MVSNDDNKIYIGDIYFNIELDVYYKVEAVSSGGVYITIGVYLKRNFIGDYYWVKDKLREFNIPTKDFVKERDEKLRLIYRDDIFL